MAKQCREGVFMTFAFGMQDKFKDLYRTAKAPFRLALMARKTRPLKAGSPKLLEEEEEIQQLRNMPGNTLAIGGLIATNEIDGWVQESLSNLYDNLRYLYNKLMLVDPMFNDPVVIAGSASSSDASTDENDENMLVVVGNRHVADICLGQFMRLYSHHAFRESLQ